jgi:hypothetical protein
MSEDRAPANPGELTDRSIHVERGGPAVLVAERVRDDEVGFALRPNPGANDRP